MGARRSLTLITLCEEAECVHLSNKIGHASPSTEPETHNQDPDHDERVQGVHGGPAWQEEWRLLSGILQ